MKVRYKVSAIVAGVLAVATVIPGHASKVNLFGYYSICSFASVSTLICLAIAGVIYWVGLKDV